MVGAYLVAWFSAMSAAINSASVILPFSITELTSGINITLRLYHKKPEKSSDTELFGT
jgi:hypothetical protein